MPKYKCTNEACVAVGIERFVAKTRIIFQEGGLVVDVNGSCPECGREREVIRDPGMTTTISGTNDQKLRGGITIK